MHRADLQTGHFSAGPTAPGLSGAIWGWQTCLSIFLLRGSWAREKLALGWIHHAIRTTLTLATAALAFLQPVASAQAPGSGSNSSGIQSDGLLQFDGNWYQSDKQELDGDPSNGADVDYRVRNAQVFMTGDREEFRWIVGYEFESKKWLDVNLLGRHGRQSIQVGQFKQPNSLEALSSSKTNDFMSQAMATNAFSLGRRLGLAYRYGVDSDDRGEAAWGLTTSYFGREITDGLAHGAGFGVRAAWAHGQAGKILHLGLSYANHDTHQDSWRVRARPNADLTPIRLVDSGTLVDTDRVSMVGGEVAWIGDRVKLQAEYLLSSIDRYGDGETTLRTDGGYVSGVWNFASGKWSYKGGLPVLASTSASKMGLWQLGARYDFIDCNDRGLSGGQAESLTLGVNAYFRSNLKAAFNYVRVRSKRNGVEDDPTILEARVQLHW